MEREQWKAKAFFRKMESNNNELEDVDPDYKINATALRKVEEKEEEENNFTSERISKIIAEEFDKELSHRQKQLEEIEDKICKAQKLLHLVRYVLITSYYNKKGLEQDNSGAESNLTNFDGQSRIHPAVKKLLGKNTSLEVLNSRGKRRACNKNNYISESSTSQLSASKKPKLEPKESDESSSTPHGPDNEQNLQKNRKKTKYRIVVGNISKWMPSLENDNTTHKWMVYVRGLKEAADISRVVNKVVFYLHPSYKPHDIVEINSYPFHLSRRGWGEFPLRVQIFFKSPLNKPVSIVHNLKLDKTYTGRQTLGNETIVDLYLHDDDFGLDEREKENIHNMDTTIESASQKINDTFLNVDIKQELVENDEQTNYGIKKFDSIEDVKEEYDTDLSTDLNSTSFEHNYCYEEETVQEEVDLKCSTTCNNSFLLDHPYSLPSDEHKLPVNVNSVKNDTDVPTNEQTNTLVYGLGEFYTDTGGKSEVKINKRGSTNNKQEKIATIDKCVFKTFTTATGQPIRFLPQSFNKVLLSNGNIIQIQLVKPSQCVLKKIDCDTPQKVNTEQRTIDYEKYKMSLPKKRFKNIGEVLPYLFKRLPLWNKLANDIDFKCTYPFVANSEAEYLSWNIGKRVNSEWCRAKVIKRILSNEIFPDLEKWNTKTFFMYGRSHGYSTSIKCSTIFRQYSKELQLLDSCFSKSLQWNRFSVEYNANDDIDVTIDIETPSASNLNMEKSRAIDVSDTSLRHHCAFVKEAALDCGIILKPEEISEGVSMNAAERMILEAVKCFAEGLIRRSRHHLVCQNHFSEEASEISVKEVQHALDERLDIKSVMTFQQQKREMEFFL